MKTLLADIHMHTLASGHAYGTIREMAAAARDRGLALIGVSEHAPGIPGTVDPFYYRNLKAVPRLLSGVEVIHGSEINVLAGGKLSLDQELIDRTPVDGDLVSRWGMRLEGMAEHLGAGGR